MRTYFRIAVLAVGVVGVLSMGPGRCGLSAEGFFSDLPAPDMRGTWDVTYDNVVDIEVSIGGAVYVGNITGGSGSMSFTHDGEPVTLDLECSDPLVICPSEIFPAEVDFEQRNFESRPHQVYMTVTESECTGEMVYPDPADCGGETGIDCDELVCDGTVLDVGVDRLASISNPVPPSPAIGSTPYYSIGIALGGGMAIPTANCVLLGASYADADIQYSGTYDTETNNMEATDLTDGLITVIYKGACFWAAGGAGNLGVALLEAEVKLTTGFTASKQ